jgi:hypothetical protein
MRRLVLTLLAFGLLAGPAHATTYYVSSRGNDTATGLSPANAWRTVQRVNGAYLRKGDAVLFEGGQTFDGPLVPPSSGSLTGVIRFASYGTGRATIGSSTSNAIYLPGRSRLVFENLTLTTYGEHIHIVASNPIGTTRTITFRNCLLTNTGAFAINSPSVTDSDWTIEDSTISRTGESGITWRGRNFVVQRNTILDTGLTPSEASHGIYAKGPVAKVVDNTIARYDRYGITVRYENSLVEGNRVSGGVGGISYFQESTLTGTTRIVYNTISNVSVVGIYVDRGSAESFVIANNTVAAGAGTWSALDIRRQRSVTLANNLVTGSFLYALQAEQPIAGYDEHHNLWYPGSGTRFFWNGIALSLTDYRAASGEGGSDLALDPRLDAGLVPQPGSPAVDAGTTDIAGLTYSGTCAGRPYTYCGSAPDLGALESAAAGPEEQPAAPPPPPPPSPPPPPPPPPPPAPAPAGGGQTYYVSRAGSDANAGTSAPAAWASLAKVNAANLLPGDRVLFEAGKMFVGTLVPRTSGTESAPIVFSSYGVGRATIAGASGPAVSLAARSDLLFANLTLSANGGPFSIVTSSGGCTRIVVRDSTLTASMNEAIHTKPPDSDWTISGNTVSNVGAASGVAILSPGARMRIHDNVISNFGARGIVVGGQNVSVVGNRINIGQTAIVVTGDAPAAAGGVTTIAYNRIWNVFAGGIAVGPSTGESFVVASNSIRAVSGAAISVARVPWLSLANNMVRGLHTFALQLIRPGTLSEHHNLWWSDAGTPVFAYGTATPATYASLSAYQLASGAGEGDRVADPLAPEPLFVPALGSPARNAGSAAVAGATYAPLCDGKPFSYCGPAPEMGATEVS